MKKLKLKIATPEEIVLEQEIDQVTLPTQMGEITILPEHLPLLGIMIPGVIEVKDGDESYPMAISGGFLEFHDDEVVILADTAEHAENIDLERAEEARQKAEKLKQESTETLDKGQYAAVISQVEKQLARIKAVKRYNPKTKHRRIPKNME